MGRLQDFPSVTPTASDNILIVQSDGQGLASVGSTLGAKMDKANPTGTGAFSLNRASGSTVGNYSFTEGLNCEASANYTHAEGSNTVASALRAHAEGNVTTASGQASHTEGYATAASSQYAHAEGQETQATAQAAHAEGRETKASGIYGHAEGYKTTASGERSHAEGSDTTASGNRSHSEGTFTIASRRSQHVFGEYNVADTSGADGTVKGAYIEIVGKGTGDANRSNARTLDWNGNETIAGTLTQSSDARLKDIKAEDIPDVSAVKAVRFTWKADAGRDDSEHIGYIAQDVEKVLPFLVKEDAEGNKMLDYIAFLVAKVDSLEKRLAELENK